MGNFAKKIIFQTMGNSTVRFFKLESITCRGKKNSKISHNISICPAIIRSAIEKRLALSKTRSNLEKICKTDFKSLIREIPIYSLLNIFAQSQWKPYRAKMFKRE
jgi:hypothetical protein